MIEFKCQADLTSSASLILFYLEEHLKLLMRKSLLKILQLIPFILSENLTVEPSLQKQLEFRLWDEGTDGVSPLQSGGDRTALGGQLNGNRNS